jgi:hypothetical protein
MQGGARGWDGGGGWRAGGGGGGRYGDDYYATTTAAYEGEYDTYEYERRRGGGGYGGREPRWSYDDLDRFGGRTGGGHGAGSKGGGGGGGGYVNGGRGGERINWGYEPRCVCRGDGVEMSPQQVPAGASDLRGGPAARPGSHAALTAG